MKHASILVLMALLVLLVQFVSAIADMEVMMEAWSWNDVSEPFPWLEYLKSLPHPEGVTLTVITRLETAILVKTKELFLNSPVAKELGIKDIVFIHAGPGLWVEYIKDAKEKGIPIDIAWGGEPALFNRIDEEGLIQPLDNWTHPEFNAILYEVEKLPERIAGAPAWKVGRDGYIYWIGTSINSFGFTINHDVIDKYGVPKPKRWADLADLEYARYLPGTPLIGIADPFMSASNTRIYEIILQAYGWEEGWRILTLMAANSKIYDSSSGVRDGVIRGEIAIGITIDFYGYTAMHQNPDCEYMMPENESFVYPDPIAVLKDTRYPVHAAAFVAWVLSEYGGQQVWLDPYINRLPINEKVFDTDIGRQRTDLKEAFNKVISAKTIQFDETKASSWERAMQTYFKATLINAHDVLQNTWAAIVQAYLDGKINEVELNYLVNELTKPFKFKDPLTSQEVTFTMDYAIRINPELENTTIFNQLLSVWEQKAEERYLEAYNELQKIIEGKITVTAITVTTTVTKTETITSTETLTKTTTVTTTETMEKTIIERMTKTETVTTTVTNISTVMQPTTITTTVTIVLGEEISPSLMAIITVLVIALVAIVVIFLATRTPVHKH